MSDHPARTPWGRGGRLNAFEWELSQKGGSTPISRIRVDLYGSLAKTGRGHGTDIAVQLGLSGEEPTSIDVSTIPERIRRIASDRKIRLTGSCEIPFDPKTDIRFHGDQQLSYHPNALRFSALFEDHVEYDSVFYSVGGGLIVKEDETELLPTHTLPFPIDDAEELLGYCRVEACRISDLVRKNELTWRSGSEIRERLLTIRDAMYDSIHRGCMTKGILPGGLGVHRRAFGTAHKLLGHSVPEQRADFIAAVRKQSRDFQNVLDWVACFALAVNEENAAFGRIVTAPTNGAAGVIPAVLMYGDCFCDLPTDLQLAFLMTAGEIGCIFKKGATISAALGGCQAEIGVSSAMAAAALTECLGGTPDQACEAAEIAMEHHLGMTCDPIAGLVQIPCIERNAMGAIKAITASQMALQRVPTEACVSLDAVIKTMWETAKDMNAKYKETSEGGLAVQIAVNVSEC